MRATSLALALFSAGCAARQAPVIPAAAPAPVQLRFLADDFPAAVAAARARGLPIFVDVWAPW